MCSWSKRKSVTMKTQRITLPIDGLSCGGGGALMIERALIRTPGVVYVYISPATEMAYVEYNPTVAEPAHLINVVEQAGFRVGVPSIR